LAKVKRRDKTIRYQTHAIRRLNQRGISYEQIEQTIKSADAVRKAKRKGTKRFEKKLSKRTRITVIAEEHASEIWVISVWR